MNCFRIALFCAMALAGGLAHASIENCRDWPSIQASSGPDLAATGMPFTYNFRLTCALGESYSILAINTQYALGDIIHLRSDSVTYAFQLPTGQILYQIRYDVPRDQTPGVYLFSGSLTIQNAQGDQKILSFPESALEVGMVGPSI